MAYKDVGEKEARNRELAQQKRVAANKRLIDLRAKDNSTSKPPAKVKPIGKVVQFKGKKRGRSGR